MSDELLEKFIKEYIESQTMPQVLFTCKTEMAVDKKGSIFHNKTVRMIEPGAENILVKESLFYLRTQENLTWQILE